MPPVNDRQSIDEPLYNSRLIKNYVEYLEKFHPEIDIDPILSDSWITTYELEDQGHWFSQWQIDSFHDLLMRTTGDPNISRKAGRYAAYSKASSALRQYALGFLTPAAAFWVVEKMNPHLTRASTLKTRRVGANKIEVTSTRNPGKFEKPYQCENRMGLFEALSNLFTKNFAKIEHPTCLHRGDGQCQYIIEWEQPSSFVLKRLRNYAAFVAVLTCAALFFFLPVASLAAIVLFFAALLMGISYYAELLDKEDLVKNIKSRGDVASLLLDQINMRYNHAQLVKEIGQATSVFFDTERLLRSVMSAMEKRLDFDRGVLWLANEEKTLLSFSTGYGYESDVAKLFKETVFQLNNPRSNGVAVQAFKRQRAFLINDIDEIKRDLSARSLEFVKQTGSRAFICVPVVYEGESLGIMFVDNIKSKRPLSQSDMSLTMGIALQIGINIHNARSYRKLQKGMEREKTLRKSFEKYVPAPIIRRFENAMATELFRGEEATITAMSLDIRDFTACTESMTAGDVVSFLNEYFEKCALVVSEENGHINKYKGNGFLAIFGAPEPLDNHTTKAFNAACKISKLSEKLVVGIKPMGIGIGLHRGRAVMGNIGGRTKIEYTAVGDTVDIALRLHGFTDKTKGFPIIMSRAVYQELDDHPHYKHIVNLGEKKIRGKDEPLETFGFRFPHKSPLPLTHAKGFIPFQRIKGV